MLTREIGNTLLDWYRINGRELPWRQTRDPYAIWISEIILQQTRVAQGIDYYLRFMTRFPDIATLADAPEDEVLKLWQGLGYYSRARNLSAAARDLRDRFGGTFPTAYDDVRSLKGIGAYTAAAICSAAYDTPIAAVDGNVYRVLSRLFDIDIPIDTTEGKRRFDELAQTLLPRRTPGRYNQAIMDFGALQCTPATPRCDNCPLCGQCLARAAGSVAQRPVKQGKTIVKSRYLNYLHFVCGTETVLRRRDSKDIWRGLYDFPVIETPAPAPFEALVGLPRFAEWTGGDFVLTRTTRLPVHKLSHQQLHAVVHRIELPFWNETLRKYTILDTARIDDYAIPRLLERYLQQDADTH